MIDYANVRLAKRVIKMAGTGHGLGDNPSSIAPAADRYRQTCFRKRSKPASRERRITSNPAWGSLRQTPMADSKQLGFNRAMRRFHRNLR
jgi:hypothetical protein